MKMTKSEVVYLLFGVLCIIQISNAAPVTDVRDGNSIVDEIIMKLKQLRQQNEGSGMTESQVTYENFNRNSNNVHPEEITRVHRTLDNLGGGYLLKRANLDSLGGGYLLKRSANSLDSLGGGYLLKRAAGSLDSLGGGYLL